jgi:hypothetical protein
MKTNAGTEKRRSPQVQWAMLANTWEQPVVQVRVKIICPNNWLTDNFTGILSPLEKLVQ